VVTRVTTLSTADGREGLAASTAGVPATRMAVVGGGSEGRVGRVAVYNPGAEPVTIDASAGADTPAEWAGVEIAANATTVLDLGQAGEHPSLTVLIEATGPVIAELRATSAGERLRPWTAVSTPEAAWRGPELRPSVRRDPSLVTVPIAPEPDEGPLLDDVIPQSPAADPPTDGADDAPEEGEAPEESDDGEAPDFAEGS
jgi:hypothetical protein